MVVNVVGVAARRRRRRNAGPGGGERRPERGGPAAGGFLAGPVQRDGVGRVVAGADGGGQLLGGQPRHVGGAEAAQLLLDLDQVPREDLRPAGDAAAGLFRGAADPLLGDGDGDEHLVPHGGGPHQILELLRRGHDRRRWVSAGRAGRRPRRRAGFRRRARSGPGSRSG